MEKLFLDYMKNRSGAKKVPDNKALQKHTPGPLITISRLYGCHGSAIGHQLVDAINQKNAARNRNTDQWRFISKEILENSAQELNMTPDLLDDLSFEQRNDIFSNLATFFSNSYYATNTKIKNTIAKVIYNYAEEGNVVITGRAAEAITKDIQRAIHVKLVASLDARAEWVRDEEALSLDAAKKLCNEEDEKRAAFRRYFEGDKDDIEYFDAILNVSKMSLDEIVEVIFLLAEQRGFF